MQRQAQPAAPATQFVTLPLVMQDPTALFEKSWKHNAREFDGNENPDYACNWLVQIDNICKVLTCNGHQKLSLAAYMFRAMADTWGKHVKELYQTTAHADAWDRFKKEFMAKFILKNITDQKHIKLEQWKQKGCRWWITVTSHETIPVHGGPCLHRGKNDNFYKGLRARIMKDVTTITKPQTM